MAYGQIYLTFPILLWTVISATPGFRTQRTEAANGRGDQREVSFQVGSKQQRGMRSSSTSHNSIEICALIHLHYVTMCLLSFPCSFHFHAPFIVAPSTQPLIKGLSLYCRLRRSQWQLGMFEARKLCITFLHLVLNEICAVLSTPSPQMWLSNGFC